MKKAISLIALPVLLSLHALAQIKGNKVQEKSRFDGTWILGKVESPSYLKTKDHENYLLIISFVDAEFKVKRNYSYKGESFNDEFILFTDRRGEKNYISETKSSGVKRNSKTQIKKNKITSDYSYETEINGKEQTFRGNEKYYLSKDGSKLIFESAQTFPSFATFLGTDNTNKFIFRRKSE